MERRPLLLRSVLKGLVRQFPSPLFSRNQLLLLQGAEAT
jgi:hypothetical protein